MAGVVDREGMKEIYPDAGGAASFTGSYLGFKFNGIHSSSYNIVRVFSSDRFDDNLFPTIKDDSADVPGADGTYYFGTKYTQNDFLISIAFDNLTELKYSQLKLWLGDGKIHDLIFDETPYKSYRAKTTGNSSFKYIPFDADGGNRLYKGEGTIQFTCFYPFAQSTGKCLNDFSSQTYPNKNEWAVGSRMANSVETSFTSTANGYLQKLNNAGDIEMNWKLIMPISAASYNIGLATASGGAISGDKLEVAGITASTGVSYLLFDSKTKLVLGMDSNRNVLNDKIYNGFVKGIFFTIPKGVDYYFTVDNSQPTSLDYNYLYF